MFHIRSAVLSSRWWPAASAAVLWGLTTASVVLWWLHLPHSDNSQSLLAVLFPSEQTLQGQSAVARALGHTGTVTAASNEQKRFRLLGVIATGEGSGSALISVDGQAPKPYLTGDALDGGWSLKTLSEQGAILGAADQTMKLDFPER